MTWILDRNSLIRLRNADAHLQTLFGFVSSHYSFPFVILETNRDKKAQEAAFREGKSHAHFGLSPHNYLPSLGLDAAPYPVNWDDIDGFKRFHDLVQAASVVVNVPIVWGGTFTNLVDMPHYELANWRQLALKYDPETLTLLDQHAQN